LLLALSVWAPSRAFASDPAGAQALFDEAKKQMAQGNFKQACTQLEESQKLDAGLGTQFQLANCWQHLGRTASAWALFREVESQARAVGQGSREKVARDRAAALEPTLSKVVINVPDDLALAVASDPSCLEVWRDGIRVGHEVWQKAMPVDPGDHTIRAVARGKSPWETTVTISSDAKTVAVQLPALKDLPGATPAAQPAMVQQPAAQPAMAQQPTEPRPTPTARVAPALGVASPMPGASAEEPILDNHGGAQRAVGWFFAGAGVVGLAAGGYFGAKWFDDHEKANLHCGGGCDAAGVRLRDDARTMGIDSIVSASAGAGGVLVGVVLVTSAPRSRIVESRAPQARVVPRVGPTQLGLDVVGAF
jgi:serine/threonine-protein kinase